MNRSLITALAVLATGFAVLGANEAKHSTPDANGSVSAIPSTNFSAPRAHLEGDGPGRHDNAVASFSLKRAISVESGRDPFRQYPDALVAPPISVSVPVPAPAPTPAPAPVIVATPSKSAINREPDPIESPVVALPTVRLLGRVSDQSTEYVWLSIGEQVLRVKQGDPIDETRRILALTNEAVIIWSSADKSHHRLQWPRADGKVRLE